MTTRVTYRSYFRNQTYQCKFSNCLENLDLDSYYSATDAL